MVDVVMSRSELAEDVAVLRDLAAQYAQVAADPLQDRRRRLWRGKNSLRPVRPLVYVRAFAWWEMPDAQGVCRDPFYRHYENWFRQELFRSRIGDDSVFEPWVTVTASYRCTGWGVSGQRNYSSAPRGSWKLDYPLVRSEDLAKLRAPWHEIDEADTARRVERLGEAIGDLITINVNRGPAYRMWSGDLSTDLGYLRGIENFMVDMVDNPEWLHRLVGFMSEGVLRTHVQAEAAGDWGLCAHQNQAMAYAEELADPAANVNGVQRSQLWGYMAAQEFTAVSPKMHDEFLLQYQLPILSAFGLSAYGCCEDLTAKIDMLRQIPNLRRIAVSPMADAARCAEQIGTDYVISYRPSPADMVGYGYDEPRIRGILREDFAALRGTLYDITLKDVETVQGDPQRARNWTRLVRDLLDEMGLT